MKISNNIIKPHECSDYGFYGTTGTCYNHNLDVVNCKCGDHPVLVCEHDDTVGFRETTYQLICPSCGEKTEESGLMDNEKYGIIDTWNNNNK